MEGDGRMKKNISSLYKPDELIAAQKILVSSGKCPGVPQLNFEDASSLLIALHKQGWRLVKTS